MLTELRAQNLGIIADLCVSMRSGMTVITGETGAGKTLLVDALELVCGGRADPQTVRDGTGEARVEARFVPEDDDSNDGDAGEIVLARVVPAVGRSRGYVNGRLATASELADWGRKLVDLHGQHAHQSLLHPVAQRTLIDRFAGADAEAASKTLRVARAAARDLRAELAQLGGDDRSRAREIDLLRYQLGEIDAAAIADIDEDADLAAEEEVLSDAEAHRAALEDAHAQLEGPAEDALGAAVAALDGREPFSQLTSRLRALQAEVAEAAHDVRLTAEGVVADPERLAEIQARRATLRELVRKYGPTLSDVVAYAADTRERLAELEAHGERAEALTSSLAEAETAARQAADQLSKVRKAHAPALGDAVTRVVRTLAMPTATFEVRIDPAPLGEDGCDEVTFLLAPNPGEPPRPLARAASGGELSRAMLALRVVLSEAPPTLVFDEVDAGIGGEAGAAVGRALASLGRRHQVLCVTHLAQVAAYADAHVRVTKVESDGRTVAEASLLLDDARVTEVSRMLAGVEESSHARRHARELLRSAATARVEVRSR
jgi:DNA repair protein RecN (Recombination protein N)